MKKSISIVLVLVTLLLISASVSVQASNYTDTTYTYKFWDDNEGAACTDVREKQDATSVYMKCQSTAYYYTAFVIGTHSETDLLRDLSGGHTYTFSTGTVHKMINYVYEKGYEYAGIFAERGYPAQYSATGLWSPDSI